MLSATKKVLQDQSFLSVILDDTNLIKQKRVKLAWPKLALMSQKCKSVDSNGTNFPRTVFSQLVV